MPARRPPPVLLAAAGIGAARALGAVATACALRSGLGNGPWDTLTVALHRASGLSVGTLAAALSALFAAAAWRLGARPHPLVLALNAVAGGLVLDWLLPRLPAAPSGAAAAGYLLASLAAAVGGALVVLRTPPARTAYDHCLVAVVGRRGWGLRRARWALDVPALGAGAALGGAVGVGTVAAALVVGPVAQAIHRAPRAVSVPPHPCRCFRRG